MTDLRKTRLRSRTFRCLRIPLSVRLYPLKTRRFQTKVGNFGYQHVAILRFEFFV